MFKGIIDNWIKDFKTNPVLFWLEFIGIAGGMIAAGTLALTVPNPPFIFIYISYMIGSTCLIVSSYLRNNGFWVILNLYFVSIDIIGLIHLLVKYGVFDKLLALMK